MSTSEFARFRAEVERLRPAAAIVLGSGLAAAATGFREVLSIPFSLAPGLVPPTVTGHVGRIALGDWDEMPALVCFGRLHFYEGHGWDVVTGLVRLLAKLGVRRLALTNSAGGIHPSLGPGSLMLIRSHLSLLDRGEWRGLASRSAAPPPYSEDIIRSMQAREAAAGRELLAGTYAAVTGPSYETPAEIRALRNCGADAVGMSTAREAEAAAALGIEVAAISCITNRAAGLGDTRLDHAEVLANARLAVGLLGEMIDKLVKPA